LHKSFLSCNPAVMDDGRRPRLKQDVSPAGCFLLLTFLLRQKKSNVSDKLKLTSKPTRSDECLQTKSPDTKSEPVVCV